MKLSLKPILIGWLAAWAILILVHIIIRLGTGFIKTTYDLDTSMILLNNLMLINLVTCITGFIGAGFAVGKFAQRLSLIHSTVSALLFGSTLSFSFYLFIEKSYTGFLFAIILLVPAPFFLIGDYLAQLQKRKKTSSMLANQEKRIEEFGKVKPD